MEPETGTGSQAERLAKLADLHLQGVLNDEEYEASAARVLGLPMSSHDATPPIPDSEPDPESEAFSAGPAPKPRRINKIIAAAVGGIIALGVVGIATSRDKAADPAPNNASPATIPDDSWVNSATVMEAVNYVWADRGTMECDAFTQQAYSGYGYADMENKFVTGYNDPTAGYGLHFPEVDGAIVFRLLMQKCTDLGY